MLIGGDTGLLLAVAEGHSRASELWASIIAGADDLALSVLSVHEVLHHFYRIGKPESGSEWVALLRTLPNIGVEPVTLAIAEKSAGYRHGLGLSTVDAVILATLVVAGADLVVTSDPDFQIAADQKIVAVEVLR